MSRAHAAARALIVALTIASTLGCGPGTLGSLEGFGSGAADDSLTQASSASADASSELPSSSESDAESDTSESDTSGGDTSGGTEGDGDGDDPLPAPVCDAWVAGAPLDPLPPEACLTRGSLPFSPDPPTGPFPPNAQDVVCGQGWGHGARVPEIAWTQEIETSTGRQRLRLDPASGVLVVSNSYQSTGGEVLRYEAYGGELLDSLDVTAHFKQPQALTIYDHERWVIAGTSEGSRILDDAVVGLIEYGELSWRVALAQGDDLALEQAELARNGDILVLGRDTTLHRLDPDGVLLWAWLGPQSSASVRMSEAPGGDIYIARAGTVVRLDASGQQLDSFSLLSRQHRAVAAVDDALLVVGSGRADEDPDFTWLELARWSSSLGTLTWLAQHRRALSWGGSTDLFNTYNNVVAHPCGGFVAAGQLGVRNYSCNTQPWVSAFDDSGALIWADRIHRCGGSVELAVGPAGDVWALTTVSLGVSPLLRRYAPA